MGEVAHESPSRGESVRTCGGGGLANEAFGEETPRPR